MHCHYNVSTWKARDPQRQIQGIERNIQIPVIFHNQEAETDSCGQKTEWLLPAFTRQDKKKKKKGRPCRLLHSLRPVVFFTTS